jgi:hypothetical protein
MFKRNMNIYRFREIKKKDTERIILYRSMQYIYINSN